MAELVDTFLAVTGSTDASTALQFLEMSGENLDVAVSLFFEHGGAVTSNATANAIPSEPVIDDDFETDEQMAQRLQQESYKTQGDEPRAPIEPRHEQLIENQGYDENLFERMGFGANQPNQFFGANRRGIFNQFDEEEGIASVESESDDEDHPPPGNATQRRLAEMFRPPFDLIEKLDLDRAKQRARLEKKWILVNIQDTTDFRCQMLNRDFWSNKSVKELVKQEFLFLQYHSDSRSGEQYRQFYHFDDYPHIAILDPLTGERLKFWSVVPNPSQWIGEVYDFLEQYSLDPNGVNPISKNKTNLNALSEDKQLEYAIRQSLNSKVNPENLDSDSEDEMYYSGDDSIEEIHGGGANDPIDLDSNSEQASLANKELTDEETFAAILPSTDPEPVEGNLTRIQIRTGDGKRVVRKFSVDDDVKAVFAYVKRYLAEQGSGEQFFILTSQRENLLGKLGETIESAGLKNASVLCEVLEDNE